MHANILEGKTTIFAIFQFTKNFFNNMSFVSSSYNFFILLKGEKRRIIKLNTSYFKVFLFNNLHIFKLICCVFVQCTMYNVYCIM